MTNTSDHTEYYPTAAVSVLPRYQGVMADKPEALADTYFICNWDHLVHVRSVFKHPLI